MKLMGTVCFAAAPRGHYTAPLPRPLFGTVSYCDAARADLIRYDGRVMAVYLYPPLAFAY